MSISIPDSFRKTVLQTFGNEGEEWLRQLPSLTEFFLKGWNLKPDGSFSDLSFNFALPVRTSSDQAAVLKLGVHKKGRAREAAVLKAYAGNGIVRLLNFSNEHGALLVERAEPGKKLKDLFLEDADEERIATIASTVMEKLLNTHPERGEHTHISTWGLGFEKYLRETNGEGSIPEANVERADQLFKQLIRTSPSETLLHGDLHHFNILSHGSGYVAIDPKGVWGDPTFEVGAFVRNPMPDILNFTDLEDRLLLRMEILADNLNFDLERVWAWSYAQSVLAAIWTARDGKASEQWLKIASALEKLEDDL